LPVCRISSAVRSTTLPPLRMPRWPAYLEHIAKKWNPVSSAQNRISVSRPAPPAGKYDGAFTRRPRELCVFCMSAAKYLLHYGNYRSVQTFVRCTTGFLLPFQARWRFPKRRITTMLTKTTIALAAALMVGGASVALANDIDESASAAQVARESRANQLPWWWNGQKQIGNAGSAYGFVPQNQNAASSGR
jgi:hypothetical protein